MQLDDLGSPGTIHDMETTIKQFLDKPDEDEQSDLSYTADQHAALVQHFHLGKLRSVKAIHGRIKELLSTVDLLRSRRRDFVSSSRPRSWRSESSGSQHNESRLKTFLNERLQDDPWHDPGNFGAFTLPEACLRILVKTTVLVIQRSSTQ